QKAQDILEKSLSQQSETTEQALGAPKIERRKVHFAEPSETKKLPQPQPFMPSVAIQQFPIHVLFVRSPAARPRTFTKEGKEIQEATPAQTHIQLKRVQGEQFQLAVMGEPKELAEGKEAFVGLSADGVATLLVQEGSKRYLVAVQLSEISDRLLISKDL